MVKNHLIQLHFQTDLDFNRKRGVLIMKYYEIKCETPYCGEDNYYYYKLEKEEYEDEYLWG